MYTSARRGGALDLWSLGLSKNFDCKFVDDGDIYIGDNSIIGAGSVVTKDIPANVIAVGSPAKVLREITEDDDRYEGGKPIPQAMLDKYQ